MKKLKLLLLAIPLLASSLSGCTKIFDYDNFQYTDKNGYIYSIETRYNEDSVAFLIGVEEDVTELIVPDDINGVPVVGINRVSYNNGESYGFNSVEHLVLGKNITQLSRYSYADLEQYYFDNYYQNYSTSDSHAWWPNLKKVSMSKSKLIDIPDNYFQGCDKLTSVTFNNGLKYIGNGAFRGCSSLKDVSLPNNVIFIGDGAFKDCSLIDRTLKLPDSLINLGAAFEGTGIIDSYEENQEETITLTTYSDEECLVAYKYDVYEYSDGCTFDYRIIGTHSIPRIYAYNGSVTFNSYSLSREIQLRNSSLSCENVYLNNTEYIGAKAFKRYETNIKRIYVNGDVKRIGKNAFDINTLETISVLSSDKYTVYDNALYEKDEFGYSLIYIPAARENTILTLWSEATSIDSNVSSNVVFDELCLYDTNLKKLFPYADGYLYNGYSNSIRNIKTKSYRLLDSSDVFSTPGGTICFKDWLILYPTYSETETYITDPSVKRIYSSSFENSERLKTIKVSRQVNTIDQHAFIIINSDYELNIYIPKEVTTISGPLFQFYGGRDSKCHIYIEGSQEQPGWDKDCFREATVHGNTVFDY